MEPRTVLSQLPPGLEIAVPPGHELPPQQPSGFGILGHVEDDTKQLTVAKQGAEDAIAIAVIVAIAPHADWKAAIGASQELFTTAAATSARRGHDQEPGSTAAFDTTALVAHPVVDRSHDTDAVDSNNQPLHSASLFCLDLDYNGFTPTRPSRAPAPPNALKLATPEKGGNVRSSVPLPTTEPARTLSLIDDFDDESEADSDWDFSPSSRRNYASWIPASPVPPRVEILDFDGASPRRRDSEVGVLRSPGMHHFETLPARRNNHMEVSYVGAKDLYHATATSIANSAKRNASSSRTSTESGRESILAPKNRLSFAAKVLQSGRKKPPMGINTVPQSSASPAAPPTVPGKQSVRSTHPDMHAHSLDDDRLRVKYSDALSRVFRWSGEHRRVASEGASPMDPLAAEPRTVATPTTATTMSSGTGSPSSATNSPNRMSRRSVQNLAAQVRRTASSMVQSKDERRRDNLRQSIRVIPEGSSV
ncbi:hypothetical protein C8034_v012364 [Colletotrichum sidae]|uniref:Uncharacterized protein n=1 Tax=Colletotrichum sidae TaxID=1347389 RepID=A0A4R8TFW7_9PEZI|nr:hypothetical protein C8034_v012364 [Colletotrichum sidae]